MPVNRRQRWVIAARHRHVVTEAGLRDAQTVIEHLMDIDRAEGDLPTAGKAFHPVEKRGNAVCFLDNHDGKFLIFLR